MDWNYSISPYDGRLDTRNCRIACRLKRWRRNRIEFRDLGGIQFGVHCEGGEVRRWGSREKMSIWKGIDVFCSTNPPNRPRVVEVRLQSRGGPSCGLSRKR